MASLYPTKDHSSIVMSDEFAQLWWSFQCFAQQQAEKNPTFALWLSYIEMVQALLLFIRATRENDWDLHLSAVRSMLPWFFAADRVHYARYGTAYWLEMSCLEETNPGKLSHLLYSTKDYLHLFYQTEEVLKYFLHFNIKR